MSVDAERVAEESRYRQARTLADAPTDAANVLAMLGDPSWRVRKAAVAALRQTGDSELAPALVGGLASGDNAGLRNACAEALVAMGPGVVSVLTAALDTDDPGQHKFVAEVLGAIGGAAAREALTATLRHADVNVRAAAAEALGRMGGEAAVRPLIAQAVATSDLMERVYLLDALAASEVRVELDVLEPWLGEPTLQRQVLALLGRCGDTRAVAPLLMGLEAPTRSTRAVAVCALANLIDAAADGHRRRIAAYLLPGSGARQAALGFLDDQDDVVLDAAVRLLGNTADARLAPQLLTACACRPVVETGARVVVNMGPAVIPPLLDAFDASGTEARVLFLEIIEVLGGVEVVPTLLEIATGPDGRACEAALRAVGRLGGIEAVDGLKALVHAREPGIARAAAMALADVGGRMTDAVADVVRTEFVSSGDQRPEWLLVLGALARSRDLDVLEASTHHHNPRIRCAAVEGGRAFGTEFPESTLAFLLTDESPRVRAASARALSAYSSDRARDALLAVTGDTDPWVVAEAVRSLGGFHGERVVSVLSDAAASSISPIAIAALRALFRLNPAGLEAIVERALTHSDPEVVRDAIAVTMRLPGTSARRLLRAALSSSYWTVRAAAARALVNRRLALPEAEVHECLMVEDEMLAAEILERLLDLSQADNRNDGVSP